jgi:hypothetical protein
MAQMRSPAMSALSPLLEHKRTQRGHDEISAIDPQRSFENSALDAFRLEDHVNCEDNRATRAPAGVPGGRLQRRTE